MSQMERQKNIPIEPETMALIESFVTSHNDYVSRLAVHETGLKGNIARLLLQLSTGGYVK